MNDSVSQQAGGVDLKKARRKRPADNGHVDRLPPHSPEAESGVLGCILLDPAICLSSVISKAKAGPEIFFDLRHATIYGVMARMFERSEPVDVITVQQKLADKNLLEQVGGIAYLNLLQDGVPSAANLDFYLAIVLEKYTLRQMVCTMTDCIGKIYDGDEEGSDVVELQDSVEATMLRIRHEVGESGTMRSMKMLSSRAIETIEMYYNRQGEVTGLPTGFIDFDKMTDGMHGGEMIIIAGRPSTGKTSLALNIVEHVALTLKQPVGIFSLEMTDEALILRMVCSLARVNLRSIRQGFMAEADFPKLRMAVDRLRESPIYIDDSPLTIMQLRARARAMVQQSDIKLLVIDYLQLVRGTAPRAKDSRQQEIADISGGIKSIAKELRIPVIALAQLNRDAEREKRQPRMSDLRESGSLEADADVVGLLYRPRKKNEEDEPIHEGAECSEVNLMIAKQRNGPTGEVPLTFLKGFTRFETAAKVSDHDVPTSRVSNDP